MRVIRGTELKYIPASHEDTRNPKVWKKVLLTNNELITGRIQMVNWAKLPRGNMFQAHYHEDMQEIFILIKGKAIMRVEEAEEVINAGDAVVVPIHSVHSMKNVGESDVEYIVFGITIGGTGKTVVT